MPGPTNAALATRYLGVATPVQLGLKADCPDVVNLSRMHGCACCTAAQDAISK